VTTASQSTPRNLLKDKKVYRQRVRQKVGMEGILRRILFLLIGLWIYIFLLEPLIRNFTRSLQDEKGLFIGLTNYVNYFSSPATSASLRHSLTISVISTVITVLLAFIYAYGLTRMTLPGRNLFNAIAMGPIFVPSLVQALAFIYMFGNNGIFTRTLNINIHLYGPVGIILSEVFYAFPHALIILMTALSLADARLYEAAESLNASPRRIFFTVTLPAVRYGLMSAAFVVFTLAITDFGAPKVVGGNYDVLATDIYNKVIGQQKFAMGATISTLLLIPAMIAFILDRIVQRRQVAQVTADIKPLGPKPHQPLVQTGMLVFCGLVALFIISVYLVVVVGAITEFWPYNFSLTLKHFIPEVAGAHHSLGGLVFIINSLKLAFFTSLIGTVVVFSSAYLIEKSRGLKAPRLVLYLLSITPLAVPGMVLGLSYLFTFNDPSHPFNFLYGTTAILVISTIFHLKQMDPEFESIGESLETPFYRTFMRVTVPVALPALISVAMYFFLNAMVTISALVFLFVPGNEVASLGVMLLDDSGNTAQAMAMSLLILVTGLTVRTLFYLLTKGIQARTQAWTQR
jgi:iron(III) transport system permease protein